MGPLFSWDSALKKGYLRIVISRQKHKVIGWREWVSLPTLRLGPIKVKVDSGARTCALHANKIRYIKQNGETWVSFLTLGKRVYAPLVEMRKVTSSIGHATIRPVILTEIQIGAEIWSTEVTLVNRDPMGFRMLLGRQALRGRYLIHPTRSFILSQPLDVAE